MLSPLLWWRLGAVSCASSVVLGAVGAHKIAVPSEDKDAKIAKNWETACYYQFTHGIGMMLCSSASFATASGRMWPRHVAGTCFAAGTAMFCGSLYAIAYTGDRAKFAKIAPYGGTAFILGWLALAFV